ncbi:hypothetical protein EOS_35440 [Caballeronia mineralivorans PML1(12)]|uniref:Uncharacterized protein n=1 Tax=Caballeronia mineralivorans PML1(12) TaxID=908627 RepID=A0A0J1FP79_9BURK|nr:hypothetical protein EOS_35440 [Caballeronia mineralivorans PML1(12)]
MADRLQVLRDSFADRRKERINLWLMPLGPAHMQLIALPIDIVEPKLGHFTRAHAIDREQHQDRPVSHVPRTIRIQSCKKTFDSCPGRAGG